MNLQHETRTAESDSREVLSRENTSGGEAVIPVCFILGSGHCGSTLLDLLLDSHPRVMGLGECERAGRTQRCSCGKAFEDCEFWQSLFGVGRDLTRNVTTVGQVDQGILDLILGRKNYCYAKADNLFVRELYEGSARGIYEYARIRSNAEALVDSSKNVTRVKLLGQTGFVRPIVIHVVRDGRGVMWSRMKKGRRGLSSLYWWIASNLKVELASRREKWEYRLVRYEDLVANPEKELTRILGMLGLDFEEGMLHFRQKPHHLIAGNQIRKNGTERIAEDVSWKRKLSMLDRMFYLLIAGPLHIYYYGVGRRRRGWKERSHETIS